MEALTYCIFCGSITKNEPKEHIVPEGLIGESFFEVKYHSIVAPCRKLMLKNDEVCRRCNSTLSTLDSYLIGQCGFLRTLWNRTGTKSGRSATSSRPGMHARRGPNGPELFLNTSRRSATMSDGLKIMPTGPQELAVRVEKFAILGRTARVEFQHPMRLNKKLMRALHKIAFELLCLEKGSAVALGSAFDPLRSYVLQGKGSRTVILTTSAPVGSWELPFFGLDHRPDWPGWVATVRLLMTFYVDLSPGNDFYRDVDFVQLHQDGMILWSDRGGGAFSLSGDEARRS